MLAAPILIATGMTLAKAVMTGDSWLALSVYRVGLTSNRSGIARIRGLEEDCGNMDPDPDAVVLAAIPEWLRQVRACTQLADLSGCVFRLCNALSMTAAAGGMLTGPKSVSDNLFYFNNWPASWLALYREKLVFGRDPIVRWALGSGAPITWLDLRARLDKSDPDLRLFELAASHGYTEGYVLPVRTTAGHLGLLSVAGDRPPLLADHQTVLQVVGTAAINRAEALTEGHATGLVAAFTARERECVALLVRGLGEQGIAAQLGISAATARFHLDNARVKMRASSRAHLATMMTGAMQDLSAPLVSGGYGSTESD